MGHTIIINQVTILFLLILIGFIIRKLNILTLELNRGLSDFLLYVTLPFSIIVSFNIPFSKTMFSNAGIVLLISLAIHIFAIFISKFLFFNYPPGANKVLRAAAIFSNCGFMGFPILTGIYGTQGIFYGSFYVLTFNILIWTVGVRIFTGNKETTLWKQAINPPVFAVVAGLILFVFSLKLPAPIFKTLEMVGSMTTPLSMIIIGSLLTEIKLSKAFTGLSIFYVSAIRLLVLPLIVIFFSALFGIRGIVLGVPALATAMPIGALVAIFAEKYGADALLASRAVFLSTLLSMITIPAVVALTQLFG